MSAVNKLERALKGFLAAVAMLALAVASSQLVAQPASAHDVLVESLPPIGSTQTSIPAHVLLTFNDKVLDLGSKANQITVKDPMGMQIASGPAKVAGNTVGQVLSPTMIMNGAYHVEFRVVSADGHPVSGAFVFYVANKPKAQPGVKVLTSGKKTLGVTLTTGPMSTGSKPVVYRGRAKFTADFANKTLCYFISTSGLDTITAIHIHPANPKNLWPSDEIFVPIALAALKASPAKPFCQTEDQVTLSNLFLNPKRFILMVHTAKYPTGAASGTFEATK